MSKLPARAGWEWVKQGFALFRKQALGLTALFFAYMIFTFWIGLVPLVGKLLSFMLIPLFTVAFMQGCAHAAQGKRVHPGMLLAALRSPAFPGLMRLGVVYMLVAAGALLASAMIDGGTLLQVLTRQIEPTAEEVKNSALPTAMLFAGALQLLAFIMLAFSAPLMHWKQMGVGKAIFYSVFGILGAVRPFLLFALAWFGISAIIGQVVFLIVGNSNQLPMVLIPVSLLYTIVVFCSFYAIYCQLFGEPDEAPAADVKAV